MQKKREILMKIKKNNVSLKKCIDCGRRMKFQEFFNQNPSLTLINAQKLWDDPLITAYCPECYFNRPEKPYKTRFRKRNKYFFKD